MHILRCEFTILCEISKGTFEILHNILNPYTAKYAFYGLVFVGVSHDIFELWSQKPSKSLHCILIVVTGIK